MENGNKNSKNRCLPLLNLLKDFCGYTSCGGLGRVVGTKFLLLKLLWVVIFLGALGMAVYQLIPLFFKYQSRPINTRISLQHNATIHFPSVVFCNFNMVRKSKIEELPVNVRNYIKEYIAEKSISKEGEEVEGREDEENEDDEGEIDPELLEKVYKKEERLSVLMAEQDENLLTEIGHKFNDMIFSCTFKGVKCMNFKKYWSRFWHYKYGNCYTFNPLVSFGNRTNGTRPLSSSKPGPLYGLTVSMNIEQYQYIDQLSQTAGATVLISERGKMPFPYEEGLSVAPGFSTSIGLRMIQINRQDRFNNGSCIKNSSDVKNNIYAKYYNITYSRTACEQSCIADNQIKTCKCLEYKYPGEKDDSYCDILNKTVVECLRKVAKKAKNNQLECSNCQPLCSDYTYQLSSSFSSWPAVKYEKFISEDLDDDEQDNIKDGGGVSKNILKVQIFFQELNFEVIEESISYQIENFLSDIGGQLGLWLGVSCLSGIEVVELMLFIIIYFCCERNRNSVTKFKVNDVIAMEEGGRVNIVVDDDKKD